MRFPDRCEAGTNIMVGTNLTQAGTYMYIIGRNEYYMCLAVQSERLTARNKNATASDIILLPPVHEGFVKT